MRPSSVYAAIVAVVLAVAPAAGGSADLTKWFLSATAYQSPGTSLLMPAPDFLPGTSLKTMACGTKTDKTLPSFDNFWVLEKYDSVHHIALAGATTDQCSVALFTAPAPGVTAPAADLSKYRTGQGIHIGSKYASVLSTYGGTRERHASHLVLRYNAVVPAFSVSVPHIPVNLPEDVWIVIDGDRVSAITIHIDESGMY